MIDFDKSKVIQGTINDSSYYLLCFWSMSCPFCIENFSTVCDFSEDYTSDIQIIFIHWPMGIDEINADEMILKTLDKFNIKFTCLDDFNHLIGDIFSVDTLPFYVFADKNKMIRKGIGKFGLKIVNQAVIRHLERNIK